MTTVYLPIELHLNPCSRIKNPLNDHVILWHFVTGVSFCPRWWGPLWLNILPEMEIKTDFQKVFFG
jgi:hypothetical protein